MIVGSGKFRYRVNADWAKLPEGWSFKRCSPIAGTRGAKPTSRIVRRCTTGHRVRYCRGA